LEHLLANFRLIAREDSPDFMNRDSFQTSWPAGGM
jgi:hypothetical protein